MIKSTTTLLCIIFALLLKAQNSEDIGYSRPTGSSPFGLNINTPTNATGSGLDGSTATNLQFATRAWSGSHAILFNSYASQNMVNGSLGTTGNTKYANNVGSYTSGAGAIMFYGNGGTLDFNISPASTGADNDINWGTPKMRIRRNGNVGIGTDDPLTKLNVHGDQYSNRISQSGGTYTELAQTTWSGSAGILFSAYASNTYVNGGLSTTGNTKYKFNSSAFGSNAHGAKMIYANHSSIGFFISPASTGVGQNVEWGDPILWLKRGGDVGIGTTNPDSKLTVKGNIHAEEVKVDLSVPGPDYVFEPTYDLKSLEEIEKFIKSEKHLPEIPSAKEMEANGVQLGEMNMLLLKKIEELTLHLIEKDKEVNELKETVMALSEKIELYLEVEKRKTKE